MKCRNFIYREEADGGPMISPDELVHRARARCKHHCQPGVGGFCRECFLAELEEAIAEELPEMKRGDVFNGARGAGGEGAGSAAGEPRGHP